MKKIFCISSINSVGCTFFDWSIHFLSGQSKFYHYTDHWIPLIDDPVTDINAHLHKKNHPSGFDASTKILTQFLNSNDAGLYSIYPALLHFDVATKLARFDISHCENSKIWKQISSIIEADYKNIFNFCSDNNIDFIYVDPDPTYRLSFLSPRSLARKKFSNDAPINAQELISEFQQVFYRSSLEKWKELNLTDTWDIRERMALDNRPFVAKEMPNFDLSKKHLWLSSSDLWFRGLTTIKKILNYLNLEIDQSRWHHWVSIYRKWQENQVSKIEFDLHFDHIIDCIINNWYYELGDLSLMQESVIQHALIYRHNLNLKTWQLEKFPSNTQDLHKLLESNIHPI